MGKSKRLRKVEKQIKLNLKNEQAKSNVSNQEHKPKVQKYKQTNVPKFYQRTGNKELDKRAREEYYKTSGRKSSKNPVSFTDIVLRNVEALIINVISNYATDTGFGQNARILKDVFQDSINQYGRTQVAKWCEETSVDLIQECNIYIFDSKEENRSVAYTAILLVLKGGEVLTPSESIQIAEETEAEFVDATDTPWQDEDEEF